MDKKNVPLIYSTARTGDEEDETDRSMVGGCWMSFFVSRAESWADPGS
jgi:hypothetical protein